MSTRNIPEWRALRDPEDRPDFPRYTDRSRRVLELAGQEALRLGHQYIATEHLLLGLIAEGDGVAAGILESLGVNLDKVRVAVEFVVGRGTDAR